MPTFLFFFFFSLYPCRQQMALFLFLQHTILYKSNKIIRNTTPLCRSSFSALDTAGMIIGVTPRTIFERMLRSRLLKCSLQFPSTVCAAWSTTIPTPNPNSTYLGEEVDNRLLLVELDINGHLLHVALGHGHVLSEHAANIIEPLPKGVLIFLLQVDNIDIIMLLRMLMLIVIVIVIVIIGSDNYTNKCKSVNSRLLVD